MRRQESECRRQVSLLEARLLEAGVKNSRRRDLLQLQVRVSRWVGVAVHTCTSSERGGGVLYLLLASVFMTVSMEIRPAKTESRSFT